MRSSQIFPWSSDSDSSNSSDTNTKQEVSVICCSRTKCWTDRNSDVVTTLKNAGILPLATKSPNDVDTMTATLAQSATKVVVICDHTITTLKTVVDSGKISPEHRQGTILVASLEDTYGLFNGFQLVVLKSEQYKSELINRVLSRSPDRQSQHQRMSVLYASTSLGQGNLKYQSQGYLKYQSRGNLKYQSQGNLMYQSQGNLKYQSQGNRKYQSQGNLMNESQGNLKYQSSSAFSKVSPVVSMRKHPARQEPSPPIHVHDIFVNTTTGYPEEGFRGVFVRERACLVPDLPDDNAISILNRYTTTSLAELGPLRKAIASQLILRCNDKNDFVSLLQLMKGGDSKLQKRLAEATFDIQLRTDPRSCSVPQLLVGISTLIELCQKDNADSDFVEKNTPLLLNTVSLLFSCMVSRDLNRQNVQNVLLECSRLLASVSVVKGKGHHPETASMYPVTEILTGLVNQLGSNRKLNKGNSKAMLSNKKLHKHIHKVPFLEKYTLVLDIVHSLRMRCSAECRIALKHVVSCLVDTKTTRTKTEPLTHAILVSVNQAIVALIRAANTASELGMYDASETICLLDIMDVYMDNSEGGHVRRTHLLGEVECLLFMKDNDLVQHVVHWHKRNGIQSQQLQNKALTHIEQILQPINFSILQVDFVPNIAFQPAWCTLHGTMDGVRNVTLHCLLPTLDCLRDGAMVDYKVKADKSKTKFEINTLEILRIVQTDCNHPGILSLHAYQCRPLPLFFVVDRFKGADLFSYLHTRRKDKNWVSNSIIAKFACGIIHAVEFLHSKNVIHRNLTASSFSLDSQMQIVLTDFSIARHVDALEISVSDLEGKDVPTRWMAPESLRDGRFEVRTDIWMIGQLLYEVYTHGCPPFVELYTLTTEKVMTWVVFHQLKPKKWPCIPHDVHGVILKCVQTEGDDRIDLTEARQFFLQCGDATTSTQSRLPVSRAYDEDKLYPELPVKQGQRMAIERGTPKLFLELRKDKNGPTSLYTRRKQKNVSVHLHVSERELMAQDQPVYNQQASYIEVTEPVTRAFVENVFPLLTGTMSNWLHIRHWPVVISTDKPEYNCSLVYGCENGKSILDIALANQFGDPSLSENMTKYHHVILSLASFIKNMHANDFLLRDMHAGNVYFSSLSRKVFMPRLGRMLHLSSHSTLDDSILANKPDTRQRWMPIEVLQSSQYSKQSDVYMFAMCLYEFFVALQNNPSEPSVNILHTVPFATVKSHLLLEHLYEGEMPPKPYRCPNWLYELMQWCWDRDRTRRPTADVVERLIKNRLHRVCGHNDRESGYDSLHQIPKHYAQKSQTNTVNRQQFRSRSDDHSTTTEHRQRRRIESLTSLCEKKRCWSTCDKNNGVTSFCANCDIPDVKDPYIPLRRKCWSDNVASSSRDTRNSTYSTISDRMSECMPSIDIVPVNRNDIASSIFDKIDNLEIEQASFPVENEKSGILGDKKSSAINKQKANTLPPMHRIVSSGRQITDPCLTVVTYLHCRHGSPHVISAEHSNPNERFS